jgi:hypothetical protein
MHTDARSTHRWDAGAWLTLLLALVVTTRTAADLITMYRVPTEGWVVEQAGVGMVGLKFFAPIVPGTALEAGDLLLAINGVPLETVMNRAHTFFRLPRPDFRPGTVWQYEVQRGDQTLTVPVTLVQVSVWQVYSARLGAVGLAGWVQVAGSLFFFVVGVAVFALRPQERAARALFLIGVGFLGNGLDGPLGATAYFHPLLAMPSSIPFDTWTLLINPSLAYLVLVFPSPKWPVRRHPWLTVAVVYLMSAVALNTDYLLNVTNRAGFDAAATVIYLAGVAFTMVVVVGGLLHSAVTLRNPGMRAQLRWMAVGMLGFVVVGIGAWALAALLQPGAGMAVTIAGQLGWFLMPACLAVAILRYRLFDIDVIIRRTLVYSVLSALLALAYFGSILVLQNVFQAVTGERRSALVTVFSTLLIAALFGPVRSRVQRVIDRRFYRQKYDAARTLAGFAASARDETDLARLSTHLVRVVDETMQPESVGLWLRRPR